MRHKYKAQARARVVFEKKGKVKTLEVFIRRRNEGRLRLNSRRLSRSAVWWAV
jgi:hypothetical protein